MAAADDLTRREFVADAGNATLGAMAAMIAPMVVPRRVLGRGQPAPRDQVNVAIVGFGGMGCQNALELAQTDRIGAVCDVDFAYSERMLASHLTDKHGKPRPDGVKLREQFGNAKRYTDFREMLAKETGVDGVVVATPDHLHAVIAKAAMDLGKHVYVQKPLTATVHEARVLRECARANAWAHRRP